MDYDLDKPSGRISEIFNIEPHRIYVPNKYPRVVQARSVFCYWAILELDQTATSLAKKLNLTQPSVSISSKRVEKIVRELGLKLSI